MNDEPTQRELDAAAAMGKRHAGAEQDLDVLFPSDPIDGEDDIRTLTFTITGRKIDPESEYASLLVTAYEDAYWEVWDHDA